MMDTLLNINKLWWWTPVLEEHIDIHGHMSYFLKTFNTVTNGRILYF